MKKFQLLTMSMVLVMMTFAQEPSPHERQLFIQGEDTLRRGY
jgi:hypothetical protein